MDMATPQNSTRVNVTDSEQIHVGDVITFNFNLLKTNPGDDDISDNEKGQREANLQMRRNNLLIRQNNLQTRLNNANYRAKTLKGKNHQLQMKEQLMVIEEQQMTLKEQQMTLREQELGRLEQYQLDAEGEKLGSLDDLAQGC